MLATVSDRFASQYRNYFGGCNQTGRFQRGIELIQSFFLPVTAFAFSAIAVPLLCVIAYRAGHLDRPNDRSSHSSPTPRNGGLAILSGAVVAMIVSGLAFPSRALLIGIALLAVVGFIDDLRSLAPSWRFATQTAAALMFVISVVDASVALRMIDTVVSPMNWFSAIVVCFWLIGFTNAFNFMDGINGIAGGNAVVSSVTFVLLSQRAGVDAYTPGLIAMSAAVAGFLLWNLAGRIFMGDVGSTAIGFFLAAMAILLSRDGVPAVALLLPLSPFILDTAATLSRRVISGERWYSAHRSHHYQKLVAAGWSHLAVAALWTAASAIGGLISVFLMTAPRELLLAACIYLFALFLIGTAIHRYAVPPEKLPG